MCHFQNRQNQRHFAWLIHSYFKWEPIRQDDFRYIRELSKVVIPMQRGNWRQTCSKSNNGLSSISWSHLFVDQRLLLVPSDNWLIDSVLSIKCLIKRNDKSQLLKTISKRKDGARARFRKNTLHLMFRRQRSQTWWITSRRLAQGNENPEVVGQLRFQHKQMKRNAKILLVHKRAIQGPSQWWYDCWIVKNEC